VRLPLDHFRLEFVLEDDEDEKHVLCMFLPSFSSPESCAYLGIASPRTMRMVQEWLDAAETQPLRRAVYQYHGRCAERWSSGNVFLAGDGIPLLSLLCRVRVSVDVDCPRLAAHLMPPFAGQGLSSGLRDAYALSWRIGLVLQGTAGPKLLSSYETERRPDVEVCRTVLSDGGEYCAKNVFVAYD